MSDSQSRTPRLETPFLRRIRPWSLVWVVAVGCLLPSQLIRAETWVDVTGKQKAEATFVALQGGHVVLKKPSGSIVQVSLSRLDASSQELARRLAGQSIAADLAPDAYIRELIAAGEAGDYYKLWHCLPVSYQQDIHEVIHLFAENMDASLWKQVTAVMKKGVRVLKEKREFILGHPQAAEAGETLAKNLPPIVEALDATVNSELTDLQKLKAFDFEKFAVADGKNIAQKYKAATEAAKELKLPVAEKGLAARPLGGLVELKPSDVTITVIQCNGDCATLKIDLRNKLGTEEEWVRSNGKWLPKKMVDEWESQIAKAKTFTSVEMKQKMNGAKMQIGFLLAPINMTLDQMLAAQSQEQFNQVIENLKRQFGGVPLAGPTSR